MKSLKDISWDVDENTYRQDPSYSYSTIARYEREGFNNLDKLFDRIETPSLLYGSLVDCLVTGSQEEFDSLYMIADFPDLPDKQKAVVEHVFHSTSGNPSWNSIDNAVFLTAVDSLNYQPNWRQDTRVRVIREAGEEYYNLLTLSGGRKVIPQSLYKEAIDSVEALKTSESTKWYFEPDNPFDTEVERLYQLKFKGEYEGIPLRIMADEIIVNHRLKQIIPVDLKTSSKHEWDFPKSFIEYSYFIQAQLYAEVIRQNIAKDDYFKDFKVQEYRFIVVNRNSLTPLVWCFNNTFCVDGCVLGDTHYRGWREIVKELDYYLKNNPKVPVGIRTDKPNSIEDYFRYDRQ